jgi:hypothetical protein
VSFTSQIHDFNPGIEASGLFWTTPIARDSVRVNLGAGAASLHVADLETEDYGNVINALQDGPSVEARVAFNISWSGADERVQIRNRTTGFAGTYVRNAATLVWSASTSGFSFQADPLVSRFAEIGQERNGLFFPQAG